MEQFSIRTMKRIIQKEGLRTGKNAAIELGNYLEDVATTIAIEAHSLAKHAGRKTVTRADILLALERLE